MPPPHAHISASVDQLGPLAPNEHGLRPGSGRRDPIQCFARIRPEIYPHQMLIHRRLSTSKQ